MAPIVNQAWAILFPSPTYVNLRPETSEPKTSRIVNQSARSWVGWSVSVRPFKTGIVAWAPSSSTSDCAKVRTIKALANPLMTFAVSEIVSPRPICRSSPRKKIGVPPRCATAVSDASLVRVDDLVI